MGNTQNNHYEVFISYRRKTGSLLARMLYYALKSWGVNAFFDYNSIRSGMFNEAIYDAIEKADCFILLLTPDALTPCADNENDWVRKEIEYAIANNKLIIPVMPSDFKVQEVMPDTLPDRMEKALRNLQVSRVDMEDLFAESIFKIIANRFPKSFNERHPRIFEEIFPERLEMMSNSISEKDDKIIGVKNYKDCLLTAIDGFKVSLYDHLIKDFLYDLQNNGGNIKMERQISAFMTLKKLLTMSNDYLPSETCNRIYDFCDDYLAKTFNDFKEYIGTLKAQGKSAKVADLVQFVSSRMDDKFYEAYGQIKDLLAGDNE